MCCLIIDTLIIFPLSSTPVKSLTLVCKSSELRPSSLYALIVSGGEFELLQWLDNYTFPTEARFKDVEHAKRVYPDVVRRIVNSGVSK
jgi:hypothetical protein